VGFVSLGIFLSISYVITKKDSDSEKRSKRVPLNLPGNRHTGERNRYQEPTLKNFSEKTLKESTALREREKPNESLRPEKYLKTENIVKGVGLSEDELKALHARQRREIELMSRNLDSIVIGPEKEGSASITLGDLLALHGQQRHEIEKANDCDEIVIPASEGGYPGLSRGELTVLHEKQESELENHGNWDELVIPASEDGYPGLSRDELTTVQEQQNYELWESIEVPYPYEPVAPPPEEGGPNLTVLELKELHKRQSLN